MRLISNAIVVTHLILSVTYSQDSIQPDSPDSTKQTTQQKTDSVLVNKNVGCSKDTDCKGDRICEDGFCVSPKPNPLINHPQETAAPTPSEAAIDSTPIVKVTFTERNNKNNIYLSKFNTISERYERIATLPCTLSLNRLDYYKFHVNDTAFGSYPFKLPNKKNINLLVDAGSKANLRSGLFLFLGGVVATGIGLTVGIINGTPTEVTDSYGYVRRVDSGKPVFPWLFGVGGGGLAICIPGAIVMSKGFTKIRDTDNNKRLDLQ